MTTTAMNIRIGILVHREESYFRELAAAFQVVSVPPSEVTCDCLIVTDRFRELTETQVPYDCLVLVLESKQDSRRIGHAGRAFAENPRLCSCILCVAGPNDLKARLIDETLRLQPRLKERIRAVTCRSLSIDYVVENVVAHYRSARAEFDGLSTNINREECPLGLVYISDLHSQVWSSTLCKALLRDIAQLDLSDKRRLLIVSGDVSNIGWSREMIKARDFVFKIAKIMEIGEDDVFVCPGNHDSATRICGIALPIFPRLHTFHNLFPAHPSSDIFETSWFRIVSLGVGFTFGIFVLDSTKTRFLARGSIPQITREWVAQKGRDFCRDNPNGVLFALLHHHVINHPNLNNRDSMIMIDDGPFRTIACTAGIDVILHGHQHLGWNTDIPAHGFADHTLHVVAAGTAVKPETSPLSRNQYNVFLVAQRGFVVYSRRWNHQVFETAVVKEKFFLRPRQHLGVFT